MQKHLFLLLLLFSSDWTYSQDLNHIQDEFLFQFYVKAGADLTCTKAQSIAQQDLSAGIYAIFIHGYDDGNNSQTFERLMYERHGIIIIFTGSCEEDSFSSCYSDISKAYLLEKFGNDLITSTEEEATQLDRSGKGDREAFYPKRKSDLEKIFYCALPQELLNSYPSSSKSISPKLTLLVDAQGMVYDIQIENCPDERLKTILFQSAGSLPTMVHATKNGKPTKGQFSIQLNIHKRRIRKICVPK